MRTNIQTREEFDNALHHMRQSKDVVVDTETNGLNPFGANSIISISVYLPEFEVGFNFPFRHGQGQVEINYSSSNPSGTSYEDMSWSGKAKKDVLLRYTYEQYRVNGMSYGNLPIEWLDDMKKVWALEGQTYYFHNASFDLNFLHMEGFPSPERVHDTMVSLHIVNEDWKGMDIVAPYTYTYTDKRKGFCKEEQVGIWATDSKGELLTKKQRGNKKLKWHAARIGLPRATEGEMGLRKARLALEEELTDYIFRNLDADHPYFGELVHRNPKKPVRLTAKYPKPIMDNTPLSLGYIKALTDIVFYVEQDYKYWEQGFYLLLDDGTITRIEDEPELIFQADRYAEIFYAMIRDGKQWDDIHKRIAVDEKAHMWMLPSGLVWDYAVLDVELTWGVYQWCLPILEAWENLELHETHQSVMYEVAWQMGIEGFHIDEGVARRRIAEYDDMITELEVILQEIAVENDMQAVFDMGKEEYFNPHSTQQLQKFLEAGVLSRDYSDIFPDWMPTNVQMDLETYDNIPQGTARDVLSKFENHPIIKLIFELKRLQKSSNVYLKNWLYGADHNNRVHFNMDSTGTVAGRFSSWGKPAGNGQNIPDRNGYRVKEAVTVPSDDWALIGIDYGQLEARLAAWIAEVLLGYGNREMTDLFLDGVDMHSYVAEKLDVRGTLYPNMSYKEIAEYVGEDWVKLIAKTESVEGAEKFIYKNYVRQVAKTCNFGLLYNGTEYMISKELGIELAPAKILVNRWRGMFPAFADAQNHYYKEALTSRNRPSGVKGHVLYVTQPISNRHRKLSGYPTSRRFEENGVTKWFNPRDASAKKCWNNVVQGLGGYICTVSALKINRLYGDKVKWFANIHDALDGHIHRDHLDIVPELCSIMTDWDVIPNLTVDVEASLTNWQNMGHVHNMSLWIETRGQEYGEEKK